jgi:hypothetical protein
MTEPNSASPQPNSASPFWPRLATIMLSLAAVGHVYSFTQGDIGAHIFTHLFIAITVLHYFLTLGVIEGDRQSRWIAILLSTTYVLTLDMSLNHLVAALANLLYLEPFWNRAWNSTSQT